MILKRHCCGVHATLNTESPSALTTPLHMLTVPLRKLSDDQIEFAEDSCLLRAETHPLTPGSPDTFQDRRIGYDAAKTDDRTRTTHGERKLLLKLDLLFLSSVMFGYFIKNLNQNNMTTAYMNGMKEHLNLSGAQLNYFQSLWTLGYTLGQVPSNLILQRVRARYFLCLLELIWCLLTFATVFCNSFWTMGLIRFLVGLFEAGFFPAASYLLGSWYSPIELTKRSTLFAQSGVAASILTGYMQAAILKHSSSLGMLPYKWLFAFDALISFPCALFTFVANPDTPATTSAWYFSSDERKLAVERLDIDHNAIEENHPRGNDGLFSTWHIYVFPLVFLAFNNSCNVSGQPTFQSWLKSTGYPPESYNIYPTAVSIVGMTVSCIFGWTADLFNGLNAFFVFLFFFCEIIGCIILALWNIPNSLHWFCYFLTGVPTSWGQPMIFAWINMILRHNDSKRSLVVVITNNIAYITNAFIPIYTWRASDMPEYSIGWTYTTFLSIFGVIMTGIAVNLSFRDASRICEQSNPNLNEEGDAFCVTLHD